METNTENLTGKKEQKYKALKITGVVVTILLLLVMIVNRNVIKYDNLTAFDIYTSMTQKTSIKERVSDYDSYVTKMSDPNGMLGEKGQYISKVGFIDSHVILPEGQTYCMSIEVFSNEEDAKNREQFFSTLQKQFEKVFPEEQYGPINTWLELDMKDRYVVRSGNAILHMTSYSDEETANMYIECFNEVLDGKTYAQGKQLTEIEMTLFLEEQNKKIEDSIEAMASAGSIEAILDLKREALNIDITAVEESLDADSLVAIKEVLPNYESQYFKDDIDTWKSRIEAVQTKVDEKTAAEEAEKEAMAQMAANKKAAGMYKVGTDIPAGEYVIFANAGGSCYFEVTSDSSGAFSSIVSNGNFDENSIVTVSEGQYLTVQNGYFYDISLNPAVSTDGEGMFKVGLHIPAGEYKIIATNSVGAYVSVNSDASHSIGSIIMNDNFTGEKYVTVSEGQYLEIIRGKIVY